jgi:regulator of cell morphogenesis and NO signaling
MKSIRSLSNNYAVPEFACPTYRVTYQKLKEFDDDLMTHVHLENNILFKKAGPQVV